MGYTITIGNAEVESSKEDGELWCRWTVESASHIGAPVFINDPTENTNMRHPSYSAWKDFAVETGLDDLFFDKYDGLMREHPGCVMLTKDHHKQILEALIQRQAKPTKPPGFSAEQMIFNDGAKTWNPPSDIDYYDYNLARLIWLEWWVEWALANCETPAIENT